VTTSELNSGMNVIEIIDEYFQTIRTFCPDHGNIIDISPPCVRLPRGVSESVSFEHTKKKVRISDLGYCISQGERGPRRICGGTQAN